MHVPKSFLPVILATLLIIAFLTPVSADSQFSYLNTASGTGSFTAGKGAFPPFISPAATPAPFIPGDSPGIRPTFQSTHSIDYLLSVNFIPGDYLAQLPPLVLENHVGNPPQYSWDDIFAGPSCGCGGC